MATSTQECRFRIWLPDHANGVLDMLLRLNQADRSFYDALEALIVRNPVAKRLTLTPRDCGRDLPEHLYPDLETVFLNPLSDGAIRPDKRTLYGRGRLVESKDESGRKSLALEDLMIITEAEYRRTAG